MIKFFSKKKLLVTHDSSFHADDVFTFGILQLYFEKTGERFRLVRTRDQKTIERADFVFDVGNVYDPARGRFDHHQKGRAGVRENGIMYAACGLVWKHFGKEIVGDERIVELLDRRIFQPLDAVDNGQELSKPLFENVWPYAMSSVVSIFNPTWKEDRTEDETFLKLGGVARELIRREIISAAAALEAETDIRRAYETAADKRIIILTTNFSRYEINRVLAELPEPIYFVYPDSKTGWKAETVRASPSVVAARKPLPVAWAGLRDADLAKVSGVSDALFCHDGLFMTKAKSQAGAVALAQKALSS